MQKSVTLKLSKQRDTSLHIARGAPEEEAHPNLSFLHEKRKTSCTHLHDPVIQGPADNLVFPVTVRNVSSQCICSSLEVTTGKKQPVQGQPQSL